MPKTTIKIEGMAEFQRALRKAPALARNRLEKGIKAGLNEWQAASEPRVPVDTGRLRREALADQNIRITRDMGILEPNVEYAAYVHEGTRYMKPRRFFEQGKNLGKRKIEQAFTEQIDDLFKEIKYITRF